jgi:hypothetical protein
MCIDVKKAPLNYLMEYYWSMSSEFILNGLPRCIASGVLIPKKNRSFGPYESR